MEEYLKEFKIFSTEEIKEFVDLGVLKIFNKNDFLIKEGMICQEIGFVISGMFRSFYYSNTGEEVTYCFTFPDNLIAAYSSYISAKGTPENIQAIVDAEVFIVPKRGFKSLIEANSKWLLFSKIIAEQQYLEMEKRIFILQKENSTTKYENLLKEQPEYLRQIPLQFIASYLGITQRHLSRIRKQIISN